MEKTPLALLLGGTLLTGLALGAGGVYLARPAPEAAPVTAPAPVPASTEVPVPAPRPADAERALEGVRSGAFQPLETIADEVRKRYPGEILGVKLSEDDGRVFYEFKVLTARGVLLEVEVDPGSGRFLDVEEDDDD